MTVERMGPVNEARFMYAMSIWAALFCERTGTGKPRDWLEVEAYSIALDNAVAERIAGRHPIDGWAGVVP